MPRAKKVVPVPQEAEPTAAAPVIDASLPASALIAEPEAPAEVPAILELEAQNPDATKPPRSLEAELPKKLFTAIVQFYTAAQLWNYEQEFKESVIYTQHTLTVIARAFHQLPYEEQAQIAALYGGFSEEQKQWARDYVTNWKAGGQQ